MNEQLKKLDKSLDTFLDDLRAAIETKRVRIIYTRGRVVLEHVIHTLVDVSGIHVKSSAFLKKASLNDCIENEQVKQKIESLSIRFEDVKFIQNAGNKSAHPNLESDKDDIPFVEKEIHAYVDKLLEICGKILLFISGDNMDLKSACKVIYLTLDMVADSSYIDDDVDYDSIDPDLLDDPVQRIPICICLDISGSMRKYGKFEQLKDGLIIFSNAILEDPKAKEAAEVAVLLFNNKCRVLYEFGRIKNVLTLDEGIVPENGTIFSDTLKKALKMLDDRKKEYAAAEVEYYQPWLVIISDGLPGDMKQCDELKPTLIEMQKNRKLAVFSIPIIPKDIEPSKEKEICNFMDGFSIDKSMVLNSQKIREFFKWLSRSASNAAQSKGNDENTSDWRKK
ncbi:MAG: VWA domain-containing protein [Clostridia bacterium]|nr:VWA domain-containing protein [Clostridia bacterium]